MGLFDLFKKKDTKKKSKKKGKKHSARKNKDKGKPKKAKSNNNSVNNAQKNNNQKTTTEPKKVVEVKQAVVNEQTTTPVNNTNQTNNEEELKEIPDSIKNNPWNVHHLHSNNMHPNIVTKTKNNEALIIHTTTNDNEEKHSKVMLKDGLVDNQEKNTYIQKSMSVIPTKKLFKKVKNSRITERDKNLIYDEIKSIPGNIEKYKKLGTLIPEEEKKKKNRN